MTSSSLAYDAAAFRRRQLFNRHDSSGHGIGAFIRMNAFVDIIINTMWKNTHTVCLGELRRSKTVQHNLKTELGCLPFFTCPIRNGR